MSPENTIRWERKNWYIFASGLFAICTGYIALRVPPAEGFLSLTLAPILLITGYCILIPWAILHRPNPAAPQAEKI